MQDVYGTELEGRVCYNSTIQYSTVQHSTAQNRMPSCTNCASTVVPHRLTVTENPISDGFFFANPAAYGTLNSLHFALYYRLVFRLLRRCRLEVLYRLRDARWFGDYHDMS